VDNEWKYLISKTGTLGDGSFVGTQSKEIETVPVSIGRSSISFSSVHAVKAKSAKNPVNTIRSRQSREMR